MRTDILDILHMMEEVLTAMITILTMAHHQATEMDQAVQAVDQ